MFVTHLAPRINLQHRIVRMRRNEGRCDKRKIDGNEITPKMESRFVSPLTSPISVRHPVWNPQALSCTTFFPLSLSRSLGVYWCPSVSPCPATPFSLSPHLAGIIKR